MSQPSPDPAVSVASDTSDSVAPAGHFRIYLGAAAGVGKTYAMLNEGRRRSQRGTDVVIGFVEPHGRLHTEEMTEGLETVPRRLVEYRGTTFPEMDLAAVLARHPKVALVDELAHSNVPGSGPHEKRWQDVLELLETGIDVITQHLESIADAVERITGVQIRERVPDWVLRKTDQIELVDSSPEQLRRRMLHGNIYPPEKVPQALHNFFRQENLTALRELSLRFLADETEEELLAYLQTRQTAVPWETSERILVAVTRAPGTDTIVRRAARMASRIKADLHAINVVTDENGGKADDQLLRLRQVATDVGADWTEVHADDPVKAIIDYARRHQITQIVLGSSARGRWQEFMGGGSIVRKVSKQAAEAGIDVHIIARRDSSPTLESGHDEGNG
jgi:two-component system, OmpR family, sensor histidine kinase KdpD